MSSKLSSGSRVLCDYAHFHRHSARRNCSTRASRLARNDVRKRVRSAGARNDPSGREWVARSRANVGRARVHGDAAALPPRGIVPVCVRELPGGPGRYPDARGHRVRSTTTSDDTVVGDAAYRDTRCGSVFVSISLPPSPPNLLTRLRTTTLLISLFRDTRYECAPPSLSLFLSLFLSSILRVSHPHVSPSPSRRLLFRPRRQLLPSHGDLRPRPRGRLLPVSTYTCHLVPRVRR